MNDLHQKDKLSYVFIFTYGRSGSTLLSGLLNSIDGYCIRGENNNALHGLFGYFRRLNNAPVGNITKSADPTHPWHGFHKINVDNIRSQIRDSFTAQVLHPEPTTRVAGFKEVRCSKKEIGNFGAYLKFVERTFSPCRIIFNHRNLKDVAKSGWWRDMPDAEEKLEFMENRFNEFPNSKSHFHFYYDKITENQSHIKELMEFLGETHNSDNVQKILNVPHSYQRKTN